MAYNSYWKFLNHQNLSPFTIIHNFLVKYTKEKVNILIIIEKTFIQ